MLEMIILYILQLVCHARSAPSLARKVRGCLADVINIHKFLTNQMFLFHSETVATPWPWYVTLIRAGGNGMAGMAITVFKVEKNDILDSNLWM